MRARGPLQSGNGASRRSEAAECPGYEAGARRTAASFERTSGHKLTIAYDSAGAVTKRIQSGEAADVAIIQRPTIERLIKEGKIASNVILARSGVAVAVRQGAPKPDIASVDALKRTLLEA